MFRYLFNLVFVIGLLSLPSFATTVIATPPLQFKCPAGQMAVLGRTSGYCPGGGACPQWTCVPMVASLDQQCPQGCKFRCVDKTNNIIDAPRCTSSKVLPACFLVPNASCPSGRVPQECVNGCFKTCPNGSKVIVCDGKCMPLVFPRDPCSTTPLR